MLGKKLGSMKKLAKKAKSTTSGNINFEGACNYDFLLIRDDDEGESTPTGMFAVYVGESRRRFVVPTSYLAHPLFKIMLEKAYNEFGFEQRNGLVVPCSVIAFQEVVSAVECFNGRFDFGELLDEFL